MTAASRLASGAATALVLAALVYDPRAEAAEPKRALGLVLTTLSVSAWLAWPVRASTLTWGTRAGLLFLALSALSLGWGLPAGSRELGTFCVALGAGLTAYQLGPLGARSTARLSALGMGGISASVALVSAARGSSAMALHAGQGNPNWLGLLLAMTLPLSLDAALALRRAPLAWRTLAFAASIVQVPALYLSHSRVAWLAAGVTSVGILIFAAPPRIRRGAPLLLALLAVPLVLAANEPHANADVPLDQALAGRVWIWKNSASAAWTALPFGVGLGRFAHAYLDAQGEELARLTPGQAARRFTNATTAHDDYLQAALESGPFAAIFLGAALILGARSHARRGWLGGASALGACALTALGDSPLHQPAIALLVGLLLGAPARTPERAVRRGAPLLGALALLALSAFLTRDALHGWLGTRERSLALDGGPRDQLARLAKSARLDPSSGETQLELGLARLGAGDARGARAALARADTLFADTKTRIAIGRAELELSAPTSAARAFERALTWNFGSFLARLGLAEARLREGRLDDAEREAVEARKLLPGDPRGRDLLDVIREAKMDR